MNPYTLTLLRHGEIDHDGRLIGRTDLPLNDLGCEQMSRSWQRLNQLAPVTSMATSPCNAAASLPCIRPAWFAAAEGGRTFCRIRFGDWDGMSRDVLSGQHPDWGSRVAAGELIPPGGGKL
jgi:broad specificity phosphatase PhoE